MIGGNTKAVIQKKTGNTKNALGQLERAYEDVQTIVGFLDLQSGDTGNSNYNVLMQESTHIFMCDYTKVCGNTSDSRMVIDGNVYQIKHIDDPMGLHRHLEFYLKYVGGGQNV